MRKLVVAAASAATLATLGLTATAQAQPTISAGLKISGPVTATVVAGIPTALQFSATPNTAKCTWTISPNVPASVTKGSGGTNKCSFLVDGVFTKPATTTYTITATAGTSSGTKKTKVTVAASPAENDAVGVGSDTIQNVMDQFSVDYNNTLTSSAAHLYSWDATNPLTGAIGDSIPEKKDCPSIARPDGSSAGINQLITFAKSTSGPFCTNFARSSRARSSSDPPYAAGGIAFVDLAGDAVTYSTQATTNAPSNLTTAQLASIYNCTVTDWGQVGGKAGNPIHAFIPQPGSGTRSFFLSAIGVANPGSCVSDDNGNLQENEGVNPVLNDPNAIFPYSIGKYIAEAFHSAKCTNSSCTPSSAGVTCIHLPGFNFFGCNTHGTMVLNSINGTAPTVGSGKKTTINPSFTATFQRIVYEVVPYDPATTDHIPGAESGVVGGVNLAPLFGASGFTCSNSTAKQDLLNYGFEVLSICGVTG